ncbi:MAG TPA: hypothetical protein VF515_21860 [Candidatus Binatia bacterium]
MLRLKTMLRAALKPGQRTATRILAVLTSCALALSLQPQTANGQAATPTAAAAPTATAAVKAEGKTIEKSDYVAKNFWLATGAVILNPFTLEACTSNNALCDLNPTAKKRFRLKTGQTTANAFFEAGYRRRWAWQDRLSAADQLATDAAVAGKGEREAAKTRLDNAQELVTVELTRALRTTGTTGAENVPAAARNELSAAQIEVAGLKVAAQKAAEDAQQNAAPELKQMGGRGSVKYLCEIAGDEGVLPIDLDVRGGFVFANGTSGGAAIVGGSDFYVAATPALNLVRWYWQSYGTETPTRGALSLELSGALSTDSAGTDTHGRYFLGLSTALGIPFRLAGTAAQPKEKNDSAPSAEPITEFIIRAGAANVETPSFLNDDTRQVAVQNEVPAFRSHWGLGVDFELNVPITEKLGYLMARAQINSGFNPDPWALQLGYTIPLSSLLAAAK